MNRYTSTIGIIILLLITTITPMTVGYKNNKESSQDIVQKTLIGNIRTTNHVWPMHKYDAQRTGRSPYDASQNDGTEKWKYFIDDLLWGSVSIDKENIIYTTFYLT